MTPWTIVAVGFVLTMLLATVLQHRAEMAKVRASGDGGYRRGFEDGLEAAAVVLDSVDATRGTAEAFARLIRAGKRKDAPR